MKERFQSHSHCFCTFWRSPDSAMFEQSKRSIRWWLNITSKSLPSHTKSFLSYSGRHGPPSWQGELSHGLWGAKKNYINAKVGCHKPRIYNDFNLIKLERKGLLADDNECRFHMWVLFYLPNVSLYFSSKRFIEREKSIGIERSCS